ncbi:MAG: TolC family protein [Bacteroidota bacterium]
MKSTIYIISFFVMVCLSHTVDAQTTDYQKVILPPSAQNVRIEERLVQLAWRNNPEAKSARDESEIAEYSLKAAKWSWLDNLSATGNLNEITLDQDNERSEFFPRYNFSINLSLGLFASAPRDVKTAKKQKEIAENEVNRAKLRIRAEVLSSYERYKMVKEIFEIQSLATEDIYSNFQLTEERFKNGEETLNNYNKVLERYNSQKITELRSKYDLDLATIQLEELIGLPLDEVL